MHDAGALVIWLDIKGWRRSVAEMEEAKNALGERPNAKTVLFD